VAPEFIEDRVAATTQPAVNPPATTTTEEELAVPDWIPRQLAAGFTFPEAEIGRINNQWVKARFRFEGALRVVGGARSPQARVAVSAQEANRVQASISAAITEWLAARVTYEQPDIVGVGKRRSAPNAPTVPDPRPNPRAGLVATARSAELRLSGELEVSVQPLRFPDEFVYVSIGITSLQPVTLFGAELTVAVTGKLKITGVPGPATLRIATAAAAETATAAAPYALAAAVIILSIAIIVATASGVEAARQAGLEHAQRISARDAFAARVAFEVVGQSAQSELESLMREWRRFLDPEVGATAGRCYNDANRQIEALRSAGTLDTARAHWTARFGQEAGQPDLSFHGVRMRMFDALGGYSAEGPTDFTLDRLQ
jgi:hypothetical protein